MSELLKVILSLSLSGTILILSLLLLRPLYRNRMSKRWQYYIWLVVIARLLIPITIPSSLVGNLFRQAGHTGPFGTTSVLSEETNESGAVNSVANQPDGMNESDQGYLENTAGNDSGNTPAASEDIMNNGSGINTESGNAARTILTLWLMTALLLFVRKATIYQSFVKYIRAGSSPVDNIALLDRFGQIIEQNQIHGRVDLCINGLVSSPLLIGFIHPCIILPTTDLSENDFYYTMQHELTHCKRRDMFYKWLVQLTVCLHWFNPFVYLMENEINRLCELSCDEKVISSLSENARKSYGDTLLNAIGIGGSYKNTLASVTLNESKKLLKGRLDAIMQYQKKSKVILITALFLTFGLICGAVSLGAYAASGGAEQHKNNSGNSTFLFDESDGSYTYTDSDMKYSIIYKDNVYRILAGGATMADCPTGGVSGDCTSLTLVFKDSYYSFLFDSSDTTDTIIKEVSGHCEDAVAENRMTKEQADLMADATKHITKFMTQHPHDMGPSVQDSFFNPSGAKRIVNAEGTFTYKQSAYFQNPYVIELGWNLPEKSQNYYDSTEITLADNSTLTVFFDASCKHFMSDQEAVSSISSLLNRLSSTSRHVNGKLPLETPFIVSMEYIGNVTDDTDLYTLAEDYYKQGNLTYFMAVFPQLNEQAQRKYLDRQFAHEEIDFFVCSIDALANAGTEKDCVDYYISKSYEEDNIDFFAVLSDLLDEESRKEWINRCRQDGNIDYLCLLDDEQYLSDTWEDKGRD